MKEDGIIKNVTEDDGHFYIDIEGSWSFGLDKKYGAIPRVGDHVTLHTKNVSTVRGVELNNIQVFYKSDADLEAERNEWLINYDKEKLATFEKNKAQLDADYESLPENFKKRIDRFRKNNPKFRVEYEDYEMFCCKEALKIAAVCKTTADITKFHALNYEGQLEMVPTLSDGHSGNTFGFSCALARFQIECPDRVSEAHGSLSVLVGSEAFGDIDPTNPQKAKERP